MPGLFKNCFSSYSPFCTKNLPVNQQDYRVNLKIRQNGKKPVLFVSQLFYIAYLSLLNTTLLQLYLVLILYKVNKETMQMLLRVVPGVLDATTCRAKI